MRSALVMALLLLLPAPALACDGVPSLVAADVVDWEGHVLHQAPSAVASGPCTFGRSFLSGDLVVTTWEGHIRVLDLTSGANWTLPGSPWISSVAGGYAFVLAKDNVTAIDLVTGKQEWWPVSELPARSQGRLAFARQGDDLVVYDLLSRAWVGNTTLSQWGLPSTTRLLGAAPGWLIVAHDGTMVALDTASGSVRSSWTEPMGFSHWELVAIDAGVAWFNEFTDTGDGGARRVDLTNGTTSMPFPSPGHATLHPGLEVSPQPTVLAAAGGHVLVSEGIAIGRATSTSSNSAPAVEGLLMVVLVAVAAVGRRRTVDCP